ncbi:hypothetical protein ACF0H5_011535 [Mactra antiquata]
MSQEKVYTLKLTDEQVSSIKDLFHVNKWELEIETLDRYIEKRDIATDYVEVNSNDRKTSSPESPRCSMARQRSKDQGKSATLPAGMSLSDTTPGIEAMKDIGATYRSFKGKFKSGSLRKGKNVLPKYEEGKSAWHVSLAPILGTTLEETFSTSDIMFDHFLVATNNTLKVITRLSTEHVNTVSRVPVRIVLLIDKSGSMLNKIGKRSRHAKITKVKHFAKQLVENLDDGDQVALVTFGEQAEIFCPLEKLTEKTRPRIQNLLDTLDTSTMSRETNLSAGLRTALRVFYEGSKSESDYLESKNSILVFTDGDFNAGTTDANSLIHEVRQNIRQVVPVLDDSRNQWVTISVVTTGSTISESAYALSKTCSSEAYYYINKDTEDPEVELFLPVLLRKSAVAWNISYIIESFKNIKFDDQKCSKDNRVRLRRSISGRGPHTEKAYFMYDFAANHSKQIGIVASWNGPQSIAQLPNEEAIFKLKVEFTNIKGERLWQEQLITKEDILNALLNKGDPEATTAACKHDMQILTNDVLRSAAEHVKLGDKEKSKAAMMNGQLSLQKLLDEYGQQSCSEEGDKAKQQISLYAKSVTENLGELISVIEKSTEGETWNRMKAVSTAIVRESPNVSDNVINSNFLCPLPEIHPTDMSSGKDPFKRLYESNKAKNRTTINLEQLLADNFA